MKNFVTIEALRGWMAWWVVVGHALHLLGAGPGGGTGPLDALPGPVLGLLVSGDTAVRVFIIVSGFVITHLMLGRQERYRAYLLRRLLRIAPIYLVCLGAMLLLDDLYRQAYIENPLPTGAAMRVTRFAEETGNFWPHLALHLTLLHSFVPDTWLPYASTTFLAPAWSLSLEWQFYLIAPVLIAVMGRGGWAALALTCGLIALKVALRHSELRWQYDGFFFLASDLFMIGILCRLALERLARGLSALAPLALVGALMLQIDPKAALIWALFFGLTLVEAGFLPRLRGVASLHRFLADNPVMPALGRWSYSTYLAHIPLYALLIGSYVGLTGAENVTQTGAAGLLVVALLLLLPLSALLYRFVETPPIRFGKWLGLQAGRAREPAQPRATPVPQEARSDALF